MAKNKKKSRTTMNAKRKQPAQTAAARSASFSLEKKIWIYGAPGAFKVHPSPKAVKKADSLRFVNLTAYTVQIDASDVFTPATPTIEPWNRSADPPEVPVDATGEVGPHGYLVHVVAPKGKERAQGRSDPEIIIDP